MMDKISVIVPIYNVEKYLSNCIESIQNQTHQNLEIILVDDGSPDGSGAICDEYARKDERIHVIHQPNSGVEKARNAAIDYFHGDYVTFIDGDDFIEPQMLELLLKLHQENNASFSMVTYRKKYDSSSCHPFIDLSKVKTRILSQDDMMKGLFSLSNMDQMLFRVVWNKLFPKELVKGSYFIETGSEDTEYNNRIYLKSSNVICGMVPMYNYVQHSTSLTHDSFNKRKLDLIDSFYIMYNTLKGHKAYQAYCLDYMYKTIFYVRHFSKGTPFEQTASKKSNYFKNLTFKNLISNDTIPFYRRLGLASLYYIPYLYDLILWYGDWFARRRRH